MVPHFLLCTFALITTNQRAGFLNPVHEQIVDSWRRANPGYRIANEIDCGDCAEQIQAIRRGMGGKWKAVPNYQPYYAVGDFNGDGHKDFAIAMLSNERGAKKFVLLVFNGPFKSGIFTHPAFVSEPMNLAEQGLFFGPPRPKPYRLVVGGFESEGMLLLPKGMGYTWDH